MAQCHVPVINVARDSQHPQNHADDGIDRHCAVQKGNGPRGQPRQDYTDRITQIVRDLAGAGLGGLAPTAGRRPETKAASMLMLTATADCAVATQRFRDSRSHASPR